MDAECNRCPIVAGIRWRARRLSGEVREPHPFPPVGSVEELVVRYGRALASVPQEPITFDMDELAEALHLFGVAATSFVKAFAEELNKAFSSLPYTFVGLVGDLIDSDASRWLRRHKWHQQRTQARIRRTPG